MSSDQSPMAWSEAISASWLRRFMRCPLALAQASDYEGASPEELKKDGSVAVYKSFERTAGIISALITKRSSFEFVDGPMDLETEI